MDTVVIEHDDRYVVDGRRLLRRVMSYRIADVPKYVLARSVFESLGDFAADAIRRLLREWKAGAAVCVGDLSAHNRILDAQARKSLLRLRIPVHFPSGEEDCPGDLGGSDPGADAAASGSATRVHVSFLQKNGQGPLVT